MEALLFKNIHYGSVEMFSEMNRKVWDPKRYPLGWILIVEAVILAVLKLSSLDWIWIAIVLALTGYGIYNLNYHKFWAKRVISKVKKKNNGQVPPATLTVTDKFTHQYKLATFSILFSELKKVYFLTHSIVLFSDEGAYMTFQRTGFTKGSPESLETFIREKCPQAKIIHKE